MLVLIPTTYFFSKSCFLAPFFKKIFFFPLVAIIPTCPFLVRYNATQLGVDGRNKLAIMFVFIRKSEKYLIIIGNVIIMVFAKNGIDIFCKTIYNISE